MDIAKKLAEFTYDLDLNNVPAEVQEKAKTCFMNSIGVGISGYYLEPAVHARAVAKQFDASPEILPNATLLMDGAKLTVPGAVAANTVLFHARAQEDTLGGCHNGTMIVPAVLALAENYPCTGKEILEATLAGYEVTSAIEKKLAKLATPRGFRPSAVFVIFGVAAACAKVLKLSEDQIADAIRIAASLAGGIQESFAAGTTEWFYQNGCAARNGLLAALLAKDGVEGASTAFTGKKGFMNVICGDNDYELVREKLELLGKEYGIMQVTFKLNPCCQIAQTPVQLALKIADEVNPDLDDIEQIKYHMHPFDSNYPGTKGKGPFFSTTQTTMSCAFNISNALVNRKCTKANMSIFDNKQILDLVDKVEVVDDENYDILCGKIVLIMKNGEKHEKELVITPAYYSLSWEEHKDMMYRIHEEVGIPKDITEKLLQTVFDLDKADDISELIKLVADPQI